MLAVAGAGCGVPTRLRGSGVPGARCGVPGADADADVDADVDAGTNADVDGVRMRTRMRTPGATFRRPGVEGIAATG